ncbi:uncharacterized protein LOC123893293 isoform X3 [Trifolium pratense]|uniref:uncharacterized protein LOC123893293 isoform X3 n=1 Tax=Trifolium pratense TaxID=57577 RepID=UPI001E697727|nr:uncharacterized protein LOC123893293 isoform X3 [Trifolium pratense]
MVELVILMFKDNCLSKFLTKKMHIFKFRCGAKQSGTLGSSSDEALDGIIGFGQSNSSVLSQLAASGKVKRIFSHCLDSINGGGTFSIGEVVEPKFNTTPLVPNIHPLNHIPEVQAMKWSIRLRPGRFFTVPEELRAPQESQHGDAVMEAFVKGRSGSVLGKGSILKMCSMNPRH